ncbi:MAG: FISUMP domain-containing protein [Candidatus Cloacimonetes bacterium]|nr:FISUMP domain-containing protein [Candidatus Cloacimonadota bacterium]
MKTRLLVFILILLVSLFSCSKSSTGPNGGGSGTVTDIDGNVYQTLIIGNQEWMVENLKVTRYRIGDQILHVTNDGTWGSTSSGAYCVYNNTPSNANIYGNLYNWYAVADTRGLAPEGWRVPSNNDIKQLEMALGMTQSQADATSWRGTNQGSRLAGRADLWTDGALENHPDFGSSGFSFLPGGYRNGSDGRFNNMSNRGDFWSSTETYSYSAWTRKLHCYETQVYRNYLDKSNGFSVRCVKGGSVTQTVTTPTFTPPAGNYATAQSVTISCTTEGAVIKYTIDGTDPTSSSPVYSSPVNISSTTTLKAKAFKDGWTPSTTAVAQYNICGGGSGTVTDIDGNVYQTLIIGDQEWMVENLKVTRYRNGDQIPHLTDGEAWKSTTAGAYCVYGNTPSNANTYGNLYNWYTVADQRGIAPQGWRVPSDNDIKQLEMFLGMTQSQADASGGRGTNQGSQLAGRADLWTDGALENDPDDGSSGFNFLPGGYRYNFDGTFRYMSTYGSFWSSTESSSLYAWYRLLYCDDTQVYRDFLNKRNGFSVRCVRSVESQ